MTVILDHTIIPASDRHRSAAFFADLLGLEIGHAGPFATVRVNDRLTFDFDDRRPATPGHWAFLVDDATFDAALARLDGGGAPFGSGPAGGWDRQVDRSGGARRVYVSDPDGHSYELFTTAA